MNIKDKIVIVTGASSGIGSATAKLFTQKGAKVALVARSKDRLEIISKELPGSLVIPTDMSDKAAIKAMVAQTKKHFGRIDILINNAGRGYDTPVEKIDSEKFHDIFNLNLVGPIIAMQQVIPIMRTQGGGIILNVSSGTALMLLQNMSAYASLKQALAKISLTAREELKKDSIQISVIYPFITATHFEQNMLTEQHETQWHQDGTEQRQMPQADSAEFIAEKILDGISKNEAEIFAHDWMKKNRTS